MLQDLALLSQILLRFIETRDLEVASVPFTRITEHKHFTPWETHDESVAFTEYSTETGPDDEPYYPLGLDEDAALFEQYVALAEAEEGVSFVGRLGTYRYLDMDKVIHEMLGYASQVAKAIEAGSPPPSISTPR